jgi:GT2 family glycosyltransferase
MSEFDLTVSFVLYNTSVNEIINIISLIKSSKLKIKIYLIDNSPKDYLRKISEFEEVVYIFNNANYGYGKGHNIAINLAKELSKYHLVLNTDVEFDPETLSKALTYMENNPDVALLSPKIRLFSGEMQYFCRMLPTPFDLFARRFVPGFLHPFLRKKLDSYILRHMDYSRPMNVPNLPGCFMFFRVSSLLKVGLFDGSFFMYVEDVDITRRLHEQFKTVYYPEIEIKHGLARGSYKFSLLTWYHINSAVYYFNKWGWFFDKKRLEINQKLIDTPAELYLPVEEPFEAALKH